MVRDGLLHCFLIAKAYSTGQKNITLMSWQVFLASKLFHKHSKQSLRALICVHERGNPFSFLWNINTHKRIITIILSSHSDLIYTQRYIPAVVSNWPTAKMQPNHKVQVHMSFHIVTSCGFKIKLLCNSCCFTSYDVTKASNTCAYLLHSIHW